MKRFARFSKQAFAALVLALPLFGTSLSAQVNTPVQTAFVKAGTPTCIKAAKKINPTTVEMTYMDGKRLTLDFYGENIVRLFRDDNGGILRDPKATPQAQILVGTARRNTGGVEVKTEGFVPEA